MNKTQRAENPTAEMIRGLMRDRSFLIERREMYPHPEAHKRSIADLNKEIGSIDFRVEAAITFYLKITCGYDTSSSATKISFETK